MVTADIDAAPAARRKRHDGLARGRRRVPGSALGPAACGVSVLRSAVGRMPPVVEPLVDGPPARPFAVDSRIPTGLGCRLLVRYRLPFSRSARSAGGPPPVRE